MANRLGPGLTLALVSAITFGTAGSFASSLLTTGWTPGAAVAARISVSALVLTVPAVWQLRGRWGQLRRNLTAVAAFGLIAVAGCQLFFFNAVQHLSVGVALLLEYMATFVVVMWLWARRGQRPRRLTVIGGAVAVVGLILILDLIGSHHLDLIGVMWGLSAAFGLAVYFVLCAEDGEDTLAPLPLAWAGMVLGALTLLAAGAVGVLPMHASTRDVVLVGRHLPWVVSILGLSVVAAVIAYVTGIGAARALGAKLASFIGLTEVVSAVIFAWLLLGQVPTAVQAVGGVLILAGVAMVRVDELRDGTAASARRVDVNPDVVPSTTG